MKTDIRYKLYLKATFLKDKLPEFLCAPIDWLRYEVLMDYNDKRHHYD